MNLYTEAAAVLEKFEQKQGSVKSLVFASGFQNIRQLYALVCESLKYQSVLGTILSRTPLLHQEEELQGQGHLATVLLYEHLVGKGLGRAGHIRKCIVKHKKAIEETCRELLTEKGVSSLCDLLSSQCQRLNKLSIPRYVRVNLLKTSLQDAVSAFKEEGWIWRQTLSLPNFIQDVESLGDHSFGLDPLLPDLLVFPPDTDLHDHPWVTGGSLVLQDRASCIPVHVLNPSQGSTVLDCCAAPGNKTSHAASVMGNTGKIIAYERDAKRMALLQNQLRKLGVRNTKTVHQDFLSVDPHDPYFDQVEFVMVDPSCSGSGIVSRMEHFNAPGTRTTDPGRLSSLQRFQISILKHALRFPSAKRVVYSTCSLHQEENEEVVAEVAPQVKDRFEVKAVLAQFPHRGEGDEEIAGKCVRTSHERDLTNGFFVACFERVSECGDEGEITMENEEEMNVSTKKSGKRKHKEIGERNGCEESKTKTVEEKEETEEKRATTSSKRSKKRKREENGKTQEDSETIKENEEPYENDVGMMEKAENVQKAQTEDPTESEEEVVTVSAKKRKRKRKCGEESGEEQNGSTSSELQTSVQHLSEKTDEDESPQKKKKKKCKSKKKKKNVETGQQDESFETTHQRSQMHFNNATILSASEDAASKKKRKSKKKNKKNAGSESLDASQSSLEESRGDSKDVPDISVNGDVGSSMSKSLKRKKKVDATDSSDCVQDTSHVDNVLIPSSAPALNAAPKTKKNKKRGDENCSFALTPNQYSNGNECGNNESEKGRSIARHIGESGLSTPVSKDTLVDRNKKKGKKKKREKQQ